MMALIEEGGLVQVVALTEEVVASAMAAQVEVAIAPGLEARAEETAEASILVVWVEEAEPAV